MQCTAAESKRRGWSGWARVAACWLVVAVAAGQVAAGQAPVVPVDHYGPPVCVAGSAAGSASAHRMTAEAARAEQEEGARDAGALLSAELLENFGIERYKLADYADCVGAGGCYWADLDAQYKRAEGALRLVAAKGAGEKLAVVMDIDETTLSSYCEMKREDFGYVGPMFNGWVVTPAAAVAIPGALRLFDEAKAAGVSVFFITGRPGVGGSSDQTAATARNLEAAGFHGWAGLALRNGAENGMTTIAYKSEERKKIAEKGYRIVVSVGDQWSDLLGEPQAAVSVKLPNPFYFLP
jgi:HAD superfamily, subfamily IIIB (Acid phosphatase)